MEAVNFKVDSLNVDSSSVVGLRPETIRTVRAGELWRATSTFAQFLTSVDLLNTERVRNRSSATKALAN